MASLRKGRSAPKGILRYSTRPPKDAEFEMLGMKNSANTLHGVVIAIEETSSSNVTISTPPKAFIPKIYTSCPTPDQSPIEGSNRQNVLTAPSSLSTPTTSFRAESPNQKEPSIRSHTSSPTLVRSSSNASVEAHSPVMRSMFPRYNPKVPLTKQHYYPDMESHPRLANPQVDVSQSSTYSTSAFTQSGQTGPILERSSGRNVAMGLDQEDNSPFRRSTDSVRAPPLSTPEELLDLWSIANGQGSQEAADTYVLKLSWLVDPCVF